MGDTMGDLEKPYRVQKLTHPDGRNSFVIMRTATIDVDERASRYLATCNEGSQRTMAYRLADFLSWRDTQHLDDETITMSDLKRYMKVIGAGDGKAGPLGTVTPWIAEPLSDPAQANAATAIRGYYLALWQHENVNKALYAGFMGIRPSSKHQLEATQSFNPSKVQRKNPLSPKSRKRGKRARIAPEDAYEALLADGVLTTSRDKMIVTWLWDAGFRVGELCGLRFEDLHLVSNHACGESKHPHVHVVKRDDNPNGAKAKTSDAPFVDKDGVIRGGTIRRVSPEMISTYWDYMIDDYEGARALADHQMVLVNLDPEHLGRALRDESVRRMLKRAGKRAELDIDFDLNPHAFRHRWATEMFRSTRNSKMVAEAGGWSNTKTVENTYAHLIDTPEMDAALDKTWKKVRKSD